MERNLQIAIDGPAAAGKSTVAKKIADQLGYIYIDTGAMYRALTYKALQTQSNLQSGSELQQILERSDIQLTVDNNGQKVLLDGQDVTQEIRTQEVTNNVSFVALHKEVREIMVYRQQLMAQLGGVVMDGRDIGTHVLPNAQLKIFLKASVDERANRRYQEIQNNGGTTSIEQLKRDIALRDERDSKRVVSPLIKANDAIEIDTTSLTIDQVVAEIMSLVRERA